MHVTLLTAHKGVDLHAATALRVIRERLDGGEHLSGLFRCELHTFSAGSVPGGESRLLTTGRYYNPNKHHFGIFELAGAPDILAMSESHDLPDLWPGTVTDSDLELETELYPRLLGGQVPGGQTAVDVVTFVRGQTGPVFSGVLWRLVLEVASRDGADLATRLAVARRRKEGLLLNPHLEQWLLAVR